MTQHLEKLFGEPSLILTELHLLAGGTLDIGQYSEVIPYTSKTCQNLERHSRKKGQNRKISKRDGDECESKPCHRIYITVQTFIFFYITLNHPRENKAHFPARGINNHLCQ